ncbi:nucleotide-binding domain containing protein [Thalassobacillus pellis]|uniref:nucleotide-binding domain containing protein n=1 Tax=Thalassobacillus pellis TaxID=748008 RepID=UPI0023BB1781|nr:nucleotide-binding domain containing protein [Thalassobacillus pellis]
MWCFILPSTPEVKEAVQLKASEWQLTTLDMAGRISQALGDITREVVNNVPELRALVLTGGDTAKDISKQLGATGFRLTRQIEAGIPQGILIGTDRLIEVVTKAGAFGSEKSIYRAMKALKGERE